MNIVGSILGYNYVSALAYPIKNQAGWDGSQAIIEDKKIFFLMFLTIR